MGKITNALKKVMDERQAQREENKRKIKQHFAPVKEDIHDLNQVTFQAKKEQPKDKTPFDDAVFDSLKSKITLKEKLGVLKGDSFYVAKANDDSGIDPRVVTHFDYFSPVSEQYRVVRTNLKTLLKKRRNARKLATIGSVNATKVVTITSSVHSEGKTLTSINLAVALSKEVESKILVIDCDLRNGVVHKRLNVDSSPGVFEVLAGKVDAAQAIHPTHIENLHIMPRGQVAAQPAELLGSKHMRQLLERLKAEKYSYIIIDTPPLIPFTDAGVIGALSDGVILVVQAHRTHSRVVKRAKQLLTHAQASLLGFILTQTDYFVPDMYGYGYYYNRYRKEKEAAEVTSESE